MKFESKSIVAALLGNAKTSCQIALGLVVAGLVFSRLITQTGPMILSFLKLGWFFACLSLFSVLLALAIEFRYSAKLLGSHAVMVFLVVTLCFTPPMIAFQHKAQIGKTDYSTNLTDRLSYKSLSHNRSFGANRLQSATPQSAKYRITGESQTSKLLSPMVIDIPVTKAFQQSLKILSQKGWKIHSQTPPPDSLSTAYIEASKNDNFLKTPDDLIIRFMAKGDGTKIDLRSSARFGSLDFGRNLAHLTSLQHQFKVSKQLKKPINTARTSTADSLMPIKDIAAPVTDEDELDVSEFDETTTGALAQETPVRALPVVKPRIAGARQRRYRAKGKRIRKKSSPAGSKRSSVTKRKAKRPAQGLNSVWDIIAAPFR